MIMPAIQIYATYLIIKYFDLLLRSLILFIVNLQVKEYFGVRKYRNYLSATTLLLTPFFVRNRFRILQLLKETFKTVRKVVNSGR